ncbi:unnamed protein product, partial [Polarella glacialis]
MASAQPLRARIARALLVTAIGCCCLSQEAAGQLPNARGPLQGAGAAAFGSPPSWAGGAASSGALPGAQTGALQDAVEGIAGLMQRFERLQPQLGALPPSEMEVVGGQAQQLHERFMVLQGKMVEAEKPPHFGAGTQLEEDLITYHKDLALFMERISGRIGVTGPGGAPPGGGFGAAGFGGLPGRSSMPSAPVPPNPSGFAPISLGSLGTGQASPPRQPPLGSMGSPPPASSVVDQRLQNAIAAIQSGMQRFEAVHARLQAVPQQVFTSIATRGQQLHE